MNLGKLFEDNKTEFKANLNDKLERTVVSFLNSKLGGDIYIGISDVGDILGVDNPEEIQLIIADRIKKQSFAYHIRSFRYKSRRN